MKKFRITQTSTEIVTKIFEITAVSEDKAIAIVEAGYFEEEDSNIDVIDIKYETEEI
jgi:hypothetical protein